MMLMPILLLVYEAPMPSDTFKTSDDARLLDIGRTDPQT